jgi:DoxX-like family
VRKQYLLLKILIAAVWLINGLFCKVLNLVPRHQQIVASILGTHHARTLTLLIGLTEIGMVVWIISGIWPRLNAITQIAIIVAMNTLEFILVPDLLLWGKANAIFAFLFVLFIYYYAFYLNPRVALRA